MASPHIATVVEHEQLVKSAEDRRRYRVLELTNGMQVVLISDPQTDKCSAAMNVHVGSMSDPRDLPGLAHFCEHMLFLGTEKYPEENEYSKYLNEHGGSSNAFTSDENTNFYFDVTPEHLAGALDRFAQFFLCPLFTASATEREVNAVNSENDKNLQSDIWRINQLEKSTAKPGHDYSKFGTGNKATLETAPRERGVDTRDELLKFHSKYYSSNIMSLAVLGKEGLDNLSDLVLPLFCNTENKNVGIPEWKENPFGTEELQTRGLIVPVKDIRNMTITWPIPDLMPYYKSNPGHYLGHLIGHEGLGSLLSELKARGWVNTLCGGQKNGAKGFMFFIVNVDLTEEGLEHVDDIITLTYQYINILKKDGIQEWIFKECQDLSAMKFRFKDKEEPSSLTCNCVCHIRHYPLHEVLSGPYLLDEFKPDLVEMVLDLLIPETMRVAVVSKKFESQANLKEEWYGTDYFMEKIPGDNIESWKNCGFHENLQLPPKNEFIPTNFDIAPKQAEMPSLPELIKDSSISRLWFKQDDQFFLPKACLSLELRSPLVYVDPAHVDMTNLFVQLFQDALNEYSYDAELAGLYYNLDSTRYGLQFSIRGYSDKQHILLRKTVEKLTDFEIDPKRFVILKEMYARRLRNFHAEQPHKHAVYYTSVVMSELSWTQEELLEALDEVTLERLRLYIPELLSKLYLEGLIYGNVTKQKALENMEMIENIFKERRGTRPLLPGQHQRMREVQLPDDCYYLYKRVNSVHSSSCIDVYYQTGMQSAIANVLLELFCQVIGEPCFNVLRTQEQLGYIVFSGIRRASGVQGLRVIIQSDKKPDYIERRVEAFLHSMDDYIGSMDEEAFQKHMSALAAKRLEKPKKMSEQNSYYWMEIIAQQYHFDRDNVEVAQLKKLTKDDLYGFYKENISHDALKRHKLSVHITSAVPQPPEEAVDMTAKDKDGLLPVPSCREPSTVSDIVDFKRDLALYPLCRPYIDIKKSTSKL